MKEGQTKKEAIRCLKRYIAREVYNNLLPATLSAHGAAAFVGDGSATLHGDGDRLSRITPAGPKAGCGVIVG